MNVEGRARKVLVAAVIVFLVGSVSLIFIFFSQRGNPYGNEVVIKNYRETVKNLSSNYENLIMSSLYQTIALNLPEGTAVPKVEDATIRDNSAIQTFIKIDNIYRGKFTVDIESLRQSYAVEYSYSSNDSNFAIGGYPIIVSCLPVNELRYGDFDCKDSTIIESEDTDLIVGLLPYSTTNFEIRAFTNDDGSARLIIKLFLTQFDYTTRESAAVKEYRAEALDWISSQGFDPSEYPIEYVY